MKIKSITGILPLMALLSACGSSESGTTTGGESGASRQITAIEAEMVAKELIKPRLRDPSSATFSNITFQQATSSRGIIICGHVNSKNGFGGMTGPQRFVTGGTVVVEEEVGQANMDIMWAEFC